MGNGNEAGDLRLHQLFLSRQCFIFETQTLNPRRCNGVWVALQLCLAADEYLGGRGSPEIRHAPAVRPHYWKNYRPSLQGKVVRRQGILESEPRGGSMKYRKIGQGPSILFLHGIPT